MKKLKVVKKTKTSSSNVTGSSPMYGLFTPMVPVVRLPFILMEVFAEGLKSLFGVTAAPKSREVREMPARKAKIRTRAA